MEAFLSNDILKLDLLPAEVLHRVASFLPCSSILTLCFLNRRLYATCYDKIIFKHNAIKAVHEDRYTNLLELLKCDCEGCAWRHIEHLDQNSFSSATTTELDSEDEWHPEPQEDTEVEDEWDFDDWGPDLVQQRVVQHREWLLNWPRVEVFHNISASDSARIAFAVERAQQCFNVSIEHQSRDLSQRWTKERWIEWLPQLIALGHMSSIELKPWTLQSLLFEPDAQWEYRTDECPIRNPCSSEYMTAGFCMLTLLLVWMETKPSIAAGSADDQEDIREQFCLPDPWSYCIWEQMDWLLMETWRIRDFDLDDRYSLIMRLMFQVWYYHRSNHTPFPSVHRLPFAATLGTPIPFRTPVDTFVRCCLDESQLVDYFTGEWLGWSKDLGGLDGHNIPPPLEGINFIVTTPHPPYATEIVGLISSSTGKDGWGAFTLEGTVSANGEVWLKKLYADRLHAPHYSREGATWRYRGAITPFGITGPFEVDTGTHIPTGMLMRRREGFFWLWKKDWSHAWPLSVP